MKPILTLSVECARARSAFRSPLVVVLVALLMSSVAAAPAPQSSGSPFEGRSYTVPGAFKVERPSLKWQFDTDLSDTDSVTLVNKDAGIQILLYWVSNVSQLDSKHATAVFESRLMRSPTFVGQNFSILKKRMLAGQLAYTFAVEKVVDQVITHRTEYVVVAQGKKCLVVAVSGGADFLDKHKLEVSDILGSIVFIRQ